VATIFFCLLLPALNLNQLSPALKKIGEGKLAASKIFETIDRVPLIKNKVNAVTLSTFKGVFKFENVSFAFPKDKTRIILKDFNL
jgi:ATP-binding cassette subfamily B (MDR/TAP) protein 1